MIPVASIAFMAISGVVAIGLPVGLFLGLRRALGLRWVPMLVGVAVFVVFVLVLESLLHRVVLHPAADGTIELRTANPWLYIAYGALAAGVFEETGRFLGFTLLKRAFRGVRTAVAYGIGHGGIEAILLVGITMVADLAISVLINAGQTDLLPPATVAALAQEPSWMFLVAGSERVMAITLHLALSVLVWVAVTHRGRRWLFPLAILLHALADVPPVMMQTGMLNLVATELLTLALVAGVTVYAVTWFRRSLAEERLAADAAS